jgi:hypothetical protein
VYSLTRHISLFDPIYMFQVNNVSICNDNIVSTVTDKTYHVYFFFVVWEIERKRRTSNTIWSTSSTPRQRNKTRKYVSYVWYQYELDRLIYRYVLNTNFGIISASSWCFNLSLPKMHDCWETYLNMKTNLNQWTLKKRSMSLESSDGMSWTFMVDQSCVVITGI